MPRPSPLSPLLLTAAASALPLPAAAQSVLSLHGETVIASGMSVPDFPAGATFGTATILGATIDRNGAMLFKARVTTSAGLGIDASNDAAYFLGNGAGDLQMVVRAGSQAPGLPTGILLRNNTATPSNGLNGAPRLSPTGGLLFFRSGLYDPVTPANTPTNADSALFWGPANNLTLLAREGDLVPFLANGERWGDLQFAHTTHHINASGAVTFQNSLRAGTGGVTTANDSMLVYGAPGNLQLALREGSPWPGSANNEVLGPVGTQLQLNGNGMVLHAVVLNVNSGTVPVTAADDKALAVWFGGVDYVVAREGDQAPQLPAGTTFTDVSPTVAFHGTSACCFNQSGQVLFRTNLSGGGTVAGVDDSALWVGGLGGQASLQKVYRRGEQAPGLAAGVRFGTVDDGSLAIDDAAVVAFTTTLQGAVSVDDDSAVWFGPVGAVQAIAREGQDVPGLAPSSNGPWQYTDLSVSVRPMLNGSGQMVLPVAASDGVTTRIVCLGFTSNGLLRVLLDDTELWSTNLGASSDGVFGFISVANNSDSTASFWNRNGDLSLLMTLPTTPTNLGHLIVRGHLGAVQATPSAVPATGGFAQDFVIDCGPGQGNRLYLFLATSLGTAPGFPSPLGPQMVPLNNDPLWTAASLDLADSPVWFNTLGFLDADGRGVGPAGFLLPPGLQGLQGTTLHHAAVVIDLTLASTFVTEPVALKLF